MSNIINLNEIKKRLVKAKAASRGDLAAELDYRTEKFLDIFDDQQKRIEALEANLKMLIKILKKHS